MSLTAAFALAACFSFAATATLFGLYVVPALRRRPLGAALVLLLWPHVFRFVALETYSAAAMGHMDSTAAALDPIVAGDVLSGALALVAIWVLSARSRAGRLVAGVAVTFGTLDIVNAVARSLADGMAGTISDLSWAVFVFFVPTLVVSSALTIWQLVARRHEALYPSSSGSDLRAVGAAR